MCIATILLAFYHTVNHNCRHRDMFYSVEKFSKKVSFYKNRWILICAPRIFLSPKLKKKKLWLSDRKIKPFLGSFFTRIFWGYFWCVVHLFLLTVFGCCQVPTRVSDESISVCLQGKLMRCSAPIQNPQSRKHKSGDIFKKLSRLRGAERL